MKSTRYKETEDQMSIKNYGGSNHKSEYDYDEKKWWDEIQTSNSHMDPEIKRNFLTICFDVYTPPWCDDDDDDDDDDDVMRWDANLQQIYKIRQLTTYL